MIFSSISQVQNESRAGFGNRQKSIWGYIGRTRKKSLRLAFVFLVAQITLEILYIYNITEYKIHYTTFFHRIAWKFSSRNIIFNSNDSFSPCCFGCPFNLSLGPLGRDSNPVEHDEFAPPSRPFETYALDFALGHKHTGTRHYKLLMNKTTTHNG